MKALHEFVEHGGAGIEVEVGVGDNEGAADSFRKAVALDPLDWEAEEDLGFALYRAGHVSEAVEHEKTALRIEPHADVARSILDALQPAGSPDSPR